jgi:hypothetical protein
MEDWEVKSVNYTQNNGNVSINIQATRIFATSSPMNKTAYDKFLKFANERGLVGENASLENWDSYAWSTIGKNSASTAAPGTKSPAAGGGSVLQQQAQELRDMQARSRTRQGL